MYDTTTEQSVFAEQVAREDFIASQGTRVISDEQVIEDCNDINLPICMDFDRFAKHLRNV